MRIAISALGATLDDTVDERFGRAMHLLVHDTETGETQAIDNSVNRNALQAAGIASAELVANAGAEVVITGHLGPKAFTALQAAHIKGYSAVGMTVGEAVEAFGAGALTELTEAGEAHQG